MQWNKGWYTYTPTSFDFITPSKVSVTSWHKKYRFKKKISKWKCLIFIMLNKTQFNWWNAQQIKWKADFNWLCFTPLSQNTVLPRYQTSVLSEESVHILIHNSLSIQCAWNATGVLIIHVIWEKRCRVSLRTLFHSLGFGLSLASTCWGFRRACFSSFLYWSRNICYLPVVAAKCKWLNNKELAPLLRPNMEKEFERKEGMCDLGHMQGEGTMLCSVCYCKSKEDSLWHCLSAHTDQGAPSHGRVAERDTSVFARLRKRHRCHFPALFE